MAVVGSRVGIDPTICTNECQSKWLPSQDLWCAFNPSTIRDPLPIWTNRSYSTLFHYSCKNHQSWKRALPNNQRKHGLYCPSWVFILYGHFPEVDRLVCSWKMLKKKAGTRDAWTLASFSQPHIWQIDAASGCFFYQIVGLGKFKLLLNAVTTIIPTPERGGWRGYWT